MSKRGGKRCDSAKQNFGWLRLHILIVIHSHATSERAEVILHWFFGRPNEPTRAWTENKNKSHKNDAENNTFDSPWHHHSMPPRRVLYRLHRSEHVLVPRRGDRVKRKVHQISLLALDPKSEIWRLTEDVVSDLIAVRRDRDSGITHFVPSCHSAIQCDRSAHVGAACASADT